MARIEGRFPGTRTPRYGSASLLGMLVHLIPNSGYKPSFSLV